MQPVHPFLSRGGAIGAALRRRYGHARAPVEPLTQSQIEALRRAAARKGAWRSPAVMDRQTRDVLIARGFIGSIGMLPSGHELFEITDAGRAELARHAP